MVKREFINSEMQLPAASVQLRFGLLFFANCLLSLWFELWLCLMFAMLSLSQYVKMSGGGSVTLVCARSFVNQFQGKTMYIDFSGVHNLK